MNAKVWRVVITPKFAPELLVSRWGDDLSPCCSVLSRRRTRATSKSSHRLRHPPRPQQYLAGGPLGGGNVPDAFIADPQTTDDDGTILLTVNGATNTYTVSYGTTTQSFTVKAAVPVTPPVTTAASVVIERLLPNPTGDDDQREEVTLRNRGAGAVSLSGWTLRDRSGLNWDLAGSIAAGQSRTFRRRQTMSLNNARDEIVMLDASQAEPDRLSYTSSSEGTVI